MSLTQLQVLLCVTAALLPLYCRFTAALLLLPPPPLLQVCMQLHGVRYADVTSEAEARGRLRAGAFALLLCCCCFTAALHHLLLHLLRITAALLLLYCCLLYVYAFSGD